MATITSPRAPQSPTSSVRSSLSIDRGSNNPSAAPQTATSGRRNRSALRDYYNLPPPAAPASNTTTTTSTVTSGPSSPPLDSSVPADSSSPLDAPNFSAPEYIQHLLATASLGDVLRTESRLLGEIRGLDGEKKALVYDNYSKLIAATDTIGRMREEMEPLTPVLGRLGGMVDGIVKAAGDIVEAQGGAEAVQKQRQVQTVKWVLGAPGRLEKLVQADRRGEAEKEWKEVQGLLEQWKDVGGVKDIQKQCEDALAPG